MTETRKPVNPACEEAVGELFDDQLLSTTLVRYNPGGNGMHRREAWRCEGDSARYYVKLFEPTDTGFFPEAAFFTEYNSLDFVTPGGAYTGLTAKPFNQAIVTQEVVGQPLDVLLRQASEPEVRQELSAIGAFSLKRLHALQQPRGFGLLTAGEFSYATWKDYIHGEIERIRSKKRFLLENGFTEYEISAITDSIEDGRECDVKPVLCQGDPKPAHVIVNEHNVGILLDFGRAQGNIAFRDCLQYGSSDPVYFDENILIETIMGGTNIDSRCVRAECLIKLTGLLGYSTQMQDAWHCHIMSRIIHEVLSDKYSRPRSSIAEFNSVHSGT